MYIVEFIITVFWVSSLFDGRNTLRTVTDMEENLIHFLFVYLEQLKYFLCFQTIIYYLFYQFLMCTKILKVFVIYRGIFTLSKIQNNQPLSLCAHPVNLTSSINPSNQISRKKKTRMERVWGQILFIYMGIFLFNPCFSLVRVFRNL